MKRKPNSNPEGTMLPAETAGLAEALAAAIDSLRSERIEQAEQALDAILVRWPEQPDALHFLGVLRHTQGRVEEAVALIRRALVQIPDHASAWNNLGNVLLLAGRGDEAAEAYEQAVRQGGAGADAVRALNNLGVLHRKLHRLDESERALRRALQLDKDFADAWYNLSTTLIQTGRVSEGLIAHGRAVVLWPEEVQSRQEVIRALLLLDERDRAARLLGEWLAGDPGNAVAEHMLAACLAADGATPPERASNGYVQQVFDGFAASFDAKLEALDYRTPERAVAALGALVGPAARSLDIVDAGCGTGLCGPGLAPFARRLAGCDLSEGMLRRAKARGVYDVLHQAELVEYLDTQPQSFDAVVSADTLCYFGALKGVLVAAHRSLRPGGALVFTVEALPDHSATPYRLQSNGRYAHADGYLRDAIAAADLDLRDLRSEMLRMEAGARVQGWLVSATRRP